MEMMADNIMIDTNVLIYATVSKSPFFVASQQAISQYVNLGYTLWINRQIIWEYMVIKSRLMFDEQRYNENLLISEFDYLVNNYKVADEVSATSAALASLIKRYKILGKQVHDANILGTCIVENISMLLTKNSNHFTRFSSEGMDIIPLLSSQGI